jgi:hypothetical protein
VIEPGVAYHENLLTNPADLSPAKLFFYLFFFGSFLLLSQSESFLSRAK